MADADAAVVRLIDDALANDGFRLKYQPIVSLQGVPVNYSVYLRLIGEGRELVPTSSCHRRATPATSPRSIAGWCAMPSQDGQPPRGRKKIVFSSSCPARGIKDDSMLMWICDCFGSSVQRAHGFVFRFRENDLRSSLQPARDLISGLRRINCRIALNNYRETAQPLLNHLEIDIVKLSPEYAAIWLLIASSRRR